MSESFHLTKEGLRELFKFGAKETTKLVRERDYLLKFATAVEIIPKLEKSGMIKFPLHMPMADKAKKLAEKSSEELQKLAYLAQHAPTQGMSIGTIAEGLGATEDGNMGELTSRFVESRIGR